MWTLLFLILAAAAFAYEGFAGLRHADGRYGGHNLLSIGLLCFTLAFLIPNLTARF